MRRNARTPMLEVWYQSIPVEAVLDALLPGAGRRPRRETAKRLRKTRGRTNLSALAAYVDDPPRRTRAGGWWRAQRLIQAASDIFLGWARGGTDGNQDFYVRQLRDMKGSGEIERMRPAELDVYASLCGAALARAHARSGQAPAIAGYLGKSDAFDRAIAAYASDYADQTERDHCALTHAIAAGRLDARDALTRETRRRWPAEMGGQGGSRVRREPASRLGPREDPNFRTARRPAVVVAV